MNKDEVTNCRGAIIESFITIEIVVNTIISQHYLGKVDTSFVIDFLNNEMSSFGFKKNILKQILNKKEHGQDFDNLEKLNRIRNLFGHASMNLKGGDDISDKSALIWFNDPRRISETIDPEIQLQEFNTLFPKVLNWLTGIGRRRDINYPAQ